MARIAGAESAGITVDGQFTAPMVESADCLERLSLPSPWPAKVRLPSTNQVWAPCSSDHSIGIASEASAGRRRHSDRLRVFGDVEANAPTGRTADSGATRKRGDVES